MKFVAAASYAAFLQEALPLQVQQITISGMSSDTEQPFPIKNSIQSSYRKHSRLRNYDYRNNGYYFITLCPRNRESLFESEKAKSAVLEKVRQIEVICKNLDSTYQTLCCEVQGRWT